MNFDKFMKDIEKKQEPKRVYTKEEIEYHNMIIIIIQYLNEINLL